MTHKETPHPEQHTDEWHTHGPAEARPHDAHTQQINIRILMISFVLMVVTVGVLVIAITLFYRSTSAQLSAERLENVTGWTDEYIPYRTAAKEQVNGFHADDPEAGTVRIPVEVAYEKVINAYGGE
ncbi:MAG: hypothetical protein AAFR76_00415 [Planctomycetota bacterium]